MNDENAKEFIYDEEGINYDDIPPVTSLKGWRRRNVDAGEYIIDGKMRALVHFEDCIELQEFDAETLEIVSIKVIEYKTGSQAQEAEPEKQEPFDYTEWRSGLQDENISVKELSRLAMAEQKA